MIHPISISRSSSCNLATPLVAFLRHTVLVFAAMAFILSARAEDGTTGVIKGKVANAATGQFLQNAVISVDGINATVRTEANGYYRFAGLPVGTHTVSANFVGLDTETHSIEVLAGEEKTLDFDLTSDVYVLGQFVVAAEREGSAKAVQQQREADTMKVVVASDSFGNMVDGNVGELMKNLPGITIDYDGEDASKMRFRGMDPSAQSVTVNGNNMASINGGDDKTSRSFSIKDFAVQNIETIEVNAAPLADQPANNLGGSVNFITKNAFSQKGRRVRIDGNLSLNSTALDFRKSPGGGRTPDRKAVPGFTLSYTEAFGKVHPFGVAVVASYAQNFRFNNSYEPKSAFNPDLLAANNGVAMPDFTGSVTSLQWTERGQSNDRKFVAANFDFKFSDSTTLFLYNSYTVDSGLGTYLHTFKIGGGTQDLSQVSFNNFITTAGTTANATTAVSTNNTKTWSVNPGVKHQFGSFELSYDGFMSVSQYNPDKAKNYSVGYALGGLGITMDSIMGDATGTIKQTSGSDYTNLAKYNSLSLYQDYYYGKDTQLGGKIDGILPMKLFGRPLVLKAGARFNEQDRQSNRYHRKYDMTGDSTSSGFGSAAEPTLPQFADGYFDNKWDFNVPVPAWISPYKVYDYFTANPTKFYNNFLIMDDANRAASSYVRMMTADRYSRERIYAGYAMATAKPLDSVTVVGGVRYEFTDLMARGWVYDGTPKIFGAGHLFDRVTTTSPYYGISDFEAVSLLLTKQRRTKSYDKIFPNLQGKWEPFKDFIVRASYTTNMSRPELGSIMPGDQIFENYNLIRRTNTRLKPQKGQNYDLKAEYYLSKTGVITAGVFHQVIKDYIYDQTWIEDRVISDGTIEPWTVTTKDNIGKGTNDGVEFSYRQRLGFITPWLDKFEFYTAFSMADPKAEYYRRAILPANNGYTDRTLTDQEVADYMNQPLVLTKIPMPGIIKKSGNARLGYNGTKFSATIAALWRDEYARSIDATTLVATKQAADLRFDLSLSYKLSSHWRTYFDWRNITDQGDKRTFFDHTAGYYTSGMAINIGVRADL